MGISSCFVLILVATVNNGAMLYVSASEARKSEVGMEMAEDHHRRLAAQLAAQMPESKDDALMVLESLRRLVECYLYSDGRARTALAIVPGAFDRDRA